ncbi:proline racemase family protein [Bacillus arachidis]|uniref:Proline racemase family protein n=1 Tax=Bacillus arachidis TaxID=2819290 RepID=A0ABS3NZB9_9BACI|nr:proline racemase family protein [Bacillus arachidis]MBO1626292.1 proline racemase family protein [Bacillus arachidis]
MKFVKAITTVDAHIAGEPLRLIMNGVPLLKGHTLQEKQKELVENYQAFRRIIMQEPRGHAAMNGCMIVPSCSEKADFAALFMDANEFISSTEEFVMIAAGVMVEMGNVQMKNDVVAVETIDGIFPVKICIEDGEIHAVSLQKDCHYELQYNASQSAISFGPNESYVISHTKHLGVKLDMDEFIELKSWAHTTRTSLSSECSSILIDATQIEEKRFKTMVQKKNGLVSRSPYVRATCACLALFREEGMLQEGESVQHENITGGTYEAKLMKYTQNEMTVQITGRVFITGMHQFLLDPSDPLADGFIIVGS